MQKTTRHICVDRIVPSQFEDVAYEKAIKENRFNQSAFEGAALYTTRWQPGRVLHVTFLEGDFTLHKKVASHALQWCKYANIDFLFDQSARAEIRVAFELHGGSWSELGTNALLYPSDVPTMNFDGSLTEKDEELAITVLHEFGHALGMIHEHQSPDSGIIWNKPAVIQFFSGPPNNWDRAKIEANVFRRYTHQQTNYTTFDPASIMVYPILREWTLNGFEARMNTALSQNDKQFIRAWYPK